MEKVDFYRFLFGHNDLIIEIYFCATNWEIVHGLLLMYDVIMITS